MNFIDAIQKLKEGQKIKRTAWHDGLYILLINGKVKSYINEYVHFQYDIDIMVSDNWLIIGEEVNKLITFPEAIEALKLNKSVKLSTWEDCFLKLDTDGTIMLKKLSQCSFSPTTDCFKANDWEIWNE